MLKQHKSTVIREIKRNFWTDEAFTKNYAGYFVTAVHQRTQKYCLTQRKLIHEGAKQRVRQKTIYRYIYPKKGMRDGL